MGNKAIMETKAKTYKHDKDVDLLARGSFYVSFTKRSETNRMLKVKEGERFKITIERMKK